MITALKHWSGHRVILTFLAVFALTLGSLAPFSNSPASAAVSDGSISFNGTGQDVTIPDSPDWDFGTGDFTIEWFQKMSGSGSWPRVFSAGGYPSADIGVSIENGTLYFWAMSGYRMAVSMPSDYLNNWKHIAISRSGTTLAIYINGTQAGTTSNNTNIIVNQTLRLGSEGGSGTYFPGLISNFHIVKGTAIYTGSSATVPTSPITPIANTKLLLKSVTSGTLLTDSSSSPKTLTTSSSPTWSSSNPFDMPVIYTVTYNYNSATGGNSTTSAGYTVGGSAITLPSPTRTGYTFGGWYSDAGLSASAGSAGASYTPSATTTLYAKWTANTLTITYNSNGGSAVSSGSTTTGGTVSSAPTAPTRTGYTFAGWYSNAGLTTAVSFPYTHGQTANFTLYAKWTANSIVVSYESNGGSSVTAGSTTTGATISSAPTAPTKAGYTFVGWYSDSGLTTAVTFPYTHGQTADFTLYAKWAAGTYTVTYNYNSATGGNGVSSDSFTTGGSAITLPTPTKTGYGFGGWYSDSGLTVSIGGAGASYSPTSNATLYAKWTANSIVVSYESNGGTTITSGSTTTGATISSAPTAPTKAGYTFVGWYSDSGLTTSVSFPYAHGQTADFILYAKWAAGTYTVTYNYNSATGGNGVSSDSFTTGGSAITLPTPTRTGFQFQGWYDANTGGNLVGAGGASFTTATSISLYGRWVQLSLAGIDPGDMVAVGTISASNLIDTTFGATTNGSSVNVSVPTGALPNGTTITMNLVTNFTRVQNILTDAHNYVVSLIVSWLAPDGTVPTTATGKPISMTISNSSIRIGDAIYLVMNGTATLVGRATTNGQVVLSVTDDPEIVIASTRPYSVTNVTATDGDVESATISWTAPSVDGGSPITGYTVTSSGGQTCTTTTTNCTISGLTAGIAYTFNVVASNAIGSATAVTSSAITPAAAPVVTPPVSVPVTLPVTTPVTPPVTTPVVPPVTTPVTPPVTEPVTPPVTEPVTPPVTKPTAAAKTISLGSSAIGMRLNTAQVNALKALKAKKGFTVTVYTKAKVTSGSKAALKSIASRISGAIKASFSKLKTTTTITGGSKLKCTAPNGVCVAITATK